MPHERPDQFALDEAWTSFNRGVARTNMDRLGDAIDCYRLASGAILPSDFSKPGDNVWLVASVLTVFSLGFLAGALVWS